MVGAVTRRVFVACGTALLAAPFVGEAQHSSSDRYRIGILIGASESFVTPFIEIFRHELRLRGYREDKNLVVDYRYADGKYERLPVLAADLVRLTPDIIVTEGTPPTRAATAATRTIPIVMTVTGDPVLAGLVTNLARPGGNLTGASFFIQDLAVKRLQLLKEVLPALSQVTVVWNPNNVVHAPVVQAIESAARPLGVEVQHVKIGHPGDVKDALMAIGQRQGGLLAIEDAMINVCSPQIARTAAEHRLSTIFGLTTFAEAGGLIAYGPNRSELWRRAAGFVDKILKGAKPGALPVEQSVRFDLVINMRTAKALGLTIPPSLLARADQVIE
jgi:putative ABC transport system substrate-binding protein